MANKVSFIIELQNRFSRQANKIRSDVQRVVSGFGKFERKIKNVSLKLIKLGRAARKAGKGIISLGKNLLLKLTLPLGVFGTAALVQSAKLETLAVAFETMTGSAEKGQKLLKQLTQFTATTPFQLEGVGKATKILLAFKVPLEKMLPTLRMLGDIAAGTNAPLSDIAQIFGKARAKGKLMTEEILQLAERGIPIIDVLAEKFNITKASIFKMASESKISFKAMQFALKSMTTTGGIFFDQTKRQSKTLGGIFSTLKDNISLTAGVFGDIIVDVFNLKKGISGLSDFFNSLRQKIKAFAKEHPTITRIIVIFTGLLLILAPLLILIGSLVIGFAALSAVIGFLGVSFLALTLPIFATVVVLGLIIAIGILIIKNWDKIKVAAKNLFETVKNFFIKMKDSVVDLGKTILDFFIRMKDLAIDFGKVILDFVLAPFLGIRDAVLSLGSLVKSTFSFGETQFETKQTSTLRSQTDVNVTLKAPENFVETIKTRSKGDRQGLNVGVNMVLAN